jgi:hypothetical protein
MVTRLSKMRYLRIAGLAVGMVLIAGVAVVVTASAAGVSFGFHPSASTQAAPNTANTVDASKSSSACSDFMKHFAVDLSKSQAEINSAFQKAIGETLADEVKNGQLTQAEADAIKKKFASQTPCSLPTSAGHKPGEGSGSKSQLGVTMQQYLAAAAAALGISESQLSADLKAGQSLADVAKARNVSEADFRTKLAANLKPMLDQAVANKSLTAAQEQAILNRLQTGELPLWTVTRKPVPVKPTPASTTES